MDEIKFTVGDVEYKVRQPNMAEIEQGQVVYNRAFNQALMIDSPLQAEVKGILTKRGLWSEKKEEELKSLQQEILEKEYILARGGIYKKEARAVALSLKKTRAKIQDLFSPISDFTQYTCEGQAQNTRFNYWVSVCVVYNDGRPYFTSLEDYLNRQNDQVAIIGSNKFAELRYGLNDDDLTVNLPENQFLREHKFVDDKNRLIDSKGRLITEDGRLINEDGNLIDEDGNLIDMLGHRLDKNGNFIVERKPFLDEADSEQDSATNNE